MSTCRTRTTASPPTTSLRRPRPRRTWRATTASATATRSASMAATSSPTTWRRGARALGPRSSAGSCSGTYALSAGYYDAYYLKAQKVRTLIKSDFDKAFESVDALVAPTSPTVAFRFGARLADPVSMYLSDACTLPVNVAGLPGLSVPCGLSEGLPVGLQLIGRPWDELRLFQLGRAYEAITADADWRSLEPRDLPLLRDATTPSAAERAGLVRAAA